MIKDFVSYFLKTVLLLVVIPYVLYFSFRVFFPYFNYIFSFFGLELIPMFFGQCFQMLAFIYCIPLVILDGDAYFEFLLSSQDNSGYWKSILFYITASFFIAILFTLVKKTLKRKKDNQ
jgi:hypothetical protein